MHLLQLKDLDDDTKIIIWGKSCRNLALPIRKHHSKVQAGDLLGFRQMVDPLKKVWFTHPPAEMPKKNPSFFFVGDSETHRFPPQVEGSRELFIQGILEALKIRTGDGQSRFGADFNPSVTTFFHGSQSLGTIWQELRTRVQKGRRVVTCPFFESNRRLKK